MSLPDRAAAVASPVAASKRLRVLTLCYEFPPLGGGGARVVHGLAKQLAADGHHVDLVTMGYRDLPTRETVDGIHVHRVKCRRKHVHSCGVSEAATYFRPAAKLARRLAAMRDYDLAHAHFILPDGLVAWRLQRRTGLPFVITAHGSDVPGYNPHRLKILHKLLVPLWQRITNAASAIAVPSEFLRDLIESQAPDARTVVVPNGYDTGRLRADAEKRNRILVVTRMLKRKGVQHVLAALDGLDTGFELDIVGDGPYLPELRAHAEALGSDARFHGWVDNEDPKMRELFESSRIFVLFSEAENFPVVLLEAMAAGNAIVTTSSTGCAQVVGDAARLVRPNDVAGLRAALGELTSDPEACAALAMAARQRIEEHFAWSVVDARYLELFRQAVATRVA